MRVPRLFWFIADWGGGFIMCSQRVFVERAVEDTARHTLFGYCRQERMTISIRRMSSL